MRAVIGPQRLFTGAPSMSFVKYITNYFFSKVINEIRSDQIRVDKQAQATAFMPVSQ